VYPPVRANAATSRSSTSSPCCMSTGASATHAAAAGIAYPSEPASCGSWCWTAVRYQRQNSADGTSANRQKPATRCRRVVRRNHGSARGTLVNGDTQVSSRVSATRVTSRAGRS
jgi:hypothetical protein